MEKANEAGSRPWMRLLLRPYSRPLLTGENRAEGASPGSRREFARREPRLRSAGKAWGPPGRRAAVRDRRRRVGRRRGAARLRRAAPPGASGRGLGERERINIEMREKREI